MLYTNTTADHAPAPVRIDRVDGIHVRLAQNIQQITDEEGGTLWQYDEVAFELPADRENETAETIAAAFADWWAYGAQPELPAPTMEERMTDVEEALLALLGM